jgi:hypothetical protein
MIRTIFASGILGGAVTGWMAHFAQVTVGHESLVPVGVACGVGAVVINLVWAASSTVTKINDRLRVIESMIKRLPCEKNNSCKLVTLDGGSEQ